MALLEELRGEFAEHDTFLHLLLGLIALAHRLDPLLPEVPGPPPREPPSPAPDEDEQRAVLLLLGLVSLRRTLRGALEPLRPASSASPDDGSTGLRDVTLHPRDLFR
jgi:hypothetical protein